MKVSQSLALNALMDKDFKLGSSEGIPLHASVSLFKGHRLIVLVVLMVNRTKVQEWNKVHPIFNPEQKEKPLLNLNTSIY